MVTLKDIIENINNSKWSKTDKDMLLAMQSNFGPASLVFLDNFIFSFGSEYEAANLIKAFEEFNKIKESPAALNQLLVSGYNTSKYDFGNYILPLVLDLKQDLQKKGNTSPELMNVITNFCLNNFQMIQVASLEYALENSFVLFVSNGDLLAELKEYFVKDYAGKEVFLRHIRELIESSQELIGERDFVLNDKSVKPTLGNWILDFVSFKKDQAVSFSVFDIVQYKNSSKNFAALNANSKKVLEEIFKVYLWTRSPQFSGQEILEYKQNKFLKSISEEDRDILFSAPLVMVQARPAPVAPLPPKKELAFSSRSQQGIQNLSQKPKIDINKKLEDLRKKVNN